MASSGMLRRVAPSSPILVTVIKEALSTSETSFLTRATWRNIPKDAILHSHRRENLKSYINEHLFLTIDSHHMIALFTLTLFVYIVRIELWPL
jgi:hypothetical protein